ncbi:glycosyltransferase [Microbacterium sp. NPDC057650]|uniref:glycosyltransferase n=1 Tax=unclassified Microbacterium TaxID=2609290 RepID=UPI0036717943
MTSILFASVPVHGHVTPLLPLAQACIARGDRVRFLTGSRFRDAVTATGAEHIPLPADADFDDRRISERFPERERLSPIKAIAHDIEHVFVRPGASQYAAVQSLLGQEAADAIVVDPTFAAGALLVDLPAHERPAVIVGGVLPLNMSADGLAPFGFGLAPLGGAPGRIRNGILQALTTRLMAPVSAAGAQICRQVHGRAPRIPVMDWMRHADAIVQLTVPSFEYPRPGIDARIEFVGPVSSSTAAVHARPAWWSELDGSRPVIHVTQGTLANDDPEDLILPAASAFAGSDALVVIATGGAPVSSLGALPENVRVAEFLPYEELLARTTLMISNGGYGGVQFALRHGVPLVIAPGKEDKVEVAARVAWSGAGVNLRTQRPTPGRLRRSADHVLGDPSYRRAAERISADIAAAPGLSGFVEVIDRAVERNPAGRLPA